MRRVAATLLIVAWLRSGALAEPLPPEGSNSDRNVTPASALRTVEDSPWIDLAPAKVLVGPGDSQKNDRRLSSAIYFGSIYAAFTIWAYAAWYRNHPELDPNKDHFGGEAFADAGCAPVRRRRC